MPPLSAVVCVASLTMLTVTTYGIAATGVEVSVFAQPLMISVRKRVEQSMPDKILFMLVLIFLASKQLHRMGCKDNVICPFTKLILRRTDNSQ